MNTVFKVVGYETKTPEGNFINSCIFWVYAKTEKEALERVETFGVDKNFYQVLEVIEKIEDAKS